MEAPRFKRILLKISGEGLASSEHTIDAERLQEIAREVKSVSELGVSICLVVGGGNIYRGGKGAIKGIDQSVGDYMGMMATVINGLALQQAFQKENLEVRLVSALEIPQVCEPFRYKKVLHHLQKGQIVIFVAGTGHPYFTTDTASALRAIEARCDAFLKSTAVDGIYDSDPKKNPNAKRYDRISYQDVLEKQLGVMDATAVALAREKKLPIVIFKQEVGQLRQVVCGNGRFSVISDE